MGDWIGEGLHQSSQCGFEVSVGSPNRGVRTSCDITSCNGTPNAVRMDHARHPERVHSGVNEASRSCSVQSICLLPV